jgi:hypothetical protein
MRMKHKEDIDNFLKKVEDRFSSFDGEYFSFGYTNFQNEYAGIDGQESIEEIEHREMLQELMAPTPYVIVYTNLNSITQTAILFGYNTYLLSSVFSALPNTGLYGNSTTVSVTVGSSNTTYLQLLQQSADMPFETALWRLQCSNIDQLTQIINENRVDADGITTVVPIVAQTYFSAYQNQNILDMPFNTKVDGNTYYTFPLLNRSTLTITIYPAKKVSRARAFSGKSVVRKYNAPKVNITGID